MQEVARCLDSGRDTVSWPGCTSGTLSFNSGGSNAGTLSVPAGAALNLGGTFVHAAGSPLGLQAKEVMARGDLVSDDILLGMLRDRFSRDDTRAGFILDGYPRNLAQAAALDKLLAELGQAFDAAVQLTGGALRYIERLVGRAKAEGRANDIPELVRHRLNVYDQQTAPVIDFYRQHGQLTVVDGVGSLDEVFTRILEAIQPGHEVG